jgi:hypothetical protein
VNDQDTTTVNPQTLTGKDNINILSGEIRWKGSQSSVNNQTDSNTDSDTATATTSTENTVETVSDTKYLPKQTQGPKEINLSFPYADGSFDKHTLESKIRQYPDDSYSGSLTNSNYVDMWKYEAYDGTIAKYEDMGMYGRGSGEDSTTTNYEGESRFNYVEGAGFYDGYFKITTTLKTYGTKTTTNNETAYAYAPDVPTGYDFDHIEVNYYEDGILQSTDTYNDSSYIGNQFSDTSYSEYTTVEVEVITYGVAPKSEEPSVSGDVSASITTDLVDGTESNWTNLSGLSKGSNSLTHSVGGSNEVEYKVKFDWELSLPTAISVASFSINGTNKNVILADTNDSALDYNFYRTQLDGDGVLAFDVVDPDDPDSIPVYIYHPTYGKLSLREKK